MAAGAIAGYALQVGENRAQGMDWGAALTTNISGEKILAGALIGGGVVLGAALASVGITAIGAAVGGACADGDCTNESKLVSQAISNGMDKIKNNSGKGYETFEAFKNAEGTAENGNAWHHIVSQLPSNIMKFGEMAVHNTNNLIQLPDRKGQLHRQITGYYNSIDPITTGSNTIRVRDWISGQSFIEQWKFGVETINRFGGTKYIIEKFLEAN